MNPLVTAIPASLIRSINAKKRPGDLDLGLGEPTLRPEMAPFDAAVRWVEEHGCPYTPNAGLPELREAIAARYGAGRFLGAGEVCVTVGSEEALYLAIKALIDPRVDEVLIVEPCYLAYPKICGMEGVPYRMVPMSAEDGFAPSAEKVLAALAPNTRMIVLNSPSNPTGRIWPEEELIALASGLAERESPVYVLADEVYTELFYTQSPPQSIARWHPHSLIAGSLSKSNALTGLRLGWLIGPEDAIAAAVKVHQFVNTAASTFSQVVALELFGQRELLSRQRQWYVGMRDRLLDGVIAAGISIIPPEGAFYALIRLPEGWGENSLAAAERLIEEERVVTLPGAAFGESAEGWLRISWACAAPVLEQGLARIGDFLDRGVPDGHDVGK